MAPVAGRPLTARGGAAGRRHLLGVGVPPGQALLLFVVAGLGHQAGGRRGAAGRRGAHGLARRIQQRLRRADEEPRGPAAHALGAVLVGAAGLVAGAVVHADAAGALGAGVAGRSGAALTGHGGAREALLGALGDADQALFAIGLTLALALTALALVAALADQTAHACLAVLLRRRPADPSHGVARHVVRAAGRDAAAGVRHAAADLLVAQLPLEAVGVALTGVHASVLDPLASPALAALAIGHAAVGALLQLDVAALTLRAAVLVEAAVDADLVVEVADPPLAQAVAVLQAALPALSVHQAADQPLDELAHPAALLAGRPAEVAVLGVRAVVVRDAAVDAAARRPEAEVAALGLIAVRRAEVGGVARAAALDDDALARAPVAVGVVRATEVVPAELVDRLALSLAFARVVTARVHGLAFTLTFAGVPVLFAFASRRVLAVVPVAAVVLVAVVQLALALARVLRLRRCAALRLTGHGRGCHEGGRQDPSERGHRITSPGSSGMRWASACPCRRPWWSRAARGPPDASCTHFCEPVRPCGARRPRATPPQ